MNEMDAWSSASEESIDGNRTTNRGRQRRDGRGEGDRGRGAERNQGGRGNRGRGDRNRGRGERNRERGWRWSNRGRGRGQIVEHEHFHLPDEGIINSLLNQTPKNIPSVDSNRVLHYLVNCYNGSCHIIDLQECSGLFASESTSETVSQSLNRCRNIKVLINEENHGLSTVRVIMTSLRLCFRHAPPKPCDRGSCKHIHLCRDFIMDCCYRKNCICSHNVDSEHNLRQITECGAQIFNTEQKLVLIKCSNMMVCSDHNSPNGCNDQGSCFRLHICNAFAMNRCLIPNNECPEGHDLWTDRNRKILKLYSADHLPEETIFKMLLAIRKRPQSFNSKMASLSLDYHEAEIPRETELIPVPERETELIPVPERETELQEHSTPNVEVIYMRSNITDEESRPLNSEHVTESEKMTSPEKKIVKFTDYLNNKYEPLPQHDVTKNVCEVFEEHECNAKNNCTDRHDSQTAYLWRVKIDGEWRKLENSSSIEKAFCDPKTNEFFDLKSISNTYIQIDFDQMKSNVGRIQRLTTPSYVNCRDKADSTIWQWYWNDSLASSGNWIPYAATGDPPYQDILEQKFQYDPMLICCFEIDKFFYELDFKTMTQTNLQTQTGRKVRRRPLKDKTAEWNRAQLYTNYRCDLSKLPVEWVPMDTESKDGTELIPLHSHDDIYKDIKLKFHATVDEAKHTIRRIYRVQNLDLWSSYQVKKEKIDKHVGTKTEVMVYHGTAEEETTRWICGVGFDQRMHGVNGTVYGKGAYFATTARYSHNYTRPSLRNNLRYMFYANITIGKVARGDGSMKRPPPIDDKNPKKGLYDSCVDNINRPSIYVIFENNQTYPAYLIEYRDNVVDTYNSMRSTSSFIPAGLSTPGYQTASVSTTTSNQYSANVNYGNVVPPSNPMAPSSGWNPPSNPTRMSSNISGSSSSASSYQPKQSSCAVM